MICDICGKESAQVRRIAETYGKGKNLLVIENVPMVSCLSCGESYFTAETLHEIERIKLHRKSHEYLIKKVDSIEQYVMSI
ncbi:MAG TPA: type II toxin-antitoxin system MqsA family antitoxin [Candidatus Brocadiaceae bacterium]|nr:type II toxin-antitoxin system MqsA family antitoxin [Candidatus Brocadiaceae bacterium]